MNIYTYAIVLHMIMHLLLKVHMAINQTSRYVQFTVYMNTTTHTHTRNAIESGLLVHSSLAYLSELAALDAKCMATAPPKERPNKIILWLSISLRARRYSKAASASMYKPEADMSTMMQ